MQEIEERETENIKERKIKQIKIERERKRLIESEKKQRGGGREGGKGWIFSKTFLCRKKDLSAASAMIGSRFQELKRNALTEGPFK